MCGRYYVDEGTEIKVQSLVQNKEKTMQKGDIHPSETATILSGEGHNLIAKDMVWGFPGYQGNSLLINARAESITERRTFRESVLSRRCVIPAKGFYEWSPKKEKYQFEQPGQVLFLAGCYDKQHRFVIITTAANASVLPVHERMPLLLSEEELIKWLHDVKTMEAILRKIPQSLQSWTQYQQMTLFEERGEDGVL